jgi:hypothetical protein
MKINVVFMFIALAIAALVGYGFFALKEGDSYQLLIAIGAGLGVFLPLSGTIALSSDSRGIVGNIRALSIVFLLVFVVSNIVFGFIKLVTPSAYIIVNGILLLVYILIGYAIAKTLK